MPKRQTEQLSRAVSVDFDQFYASQLMEAGTGLLVMSVDGKGVVMPQQDRREATRKAAEAVEAQTQDPPQSRREA